MKRRDFVSGVCGAAVAPAAFWPLKVNAQQDRRIRRIGILTRGVETDRFVQAQLGALREGLAKLGWIKGRNVQWARGPYDRLPALVTELVQRKVAVIVANSTPALAAKAATTTVPIVFSAPGDPIELGLVSSLNRPGGNLTGVSSWAAELGPKRLQLLHELLPTATTMVALVNPKGRNAEIQSREFTTAAAALGLQLHVLHASSEADFDRAFATAARLRAGGLVISADPLFNAWVERLADLASRHAIPTIYQYREFTATGALMSYGGAINENYRLVGIYTGRVLKGEKTGDMPVQLATKLELIINLKTAKVLGLGIPPTLRALANEVIE
jgi:putative ABC transport system substrate-binding protein